MSQLRAGLPLSISFVTIAAVLSIAAPGAARGQQKPAPPEKTAGSSDPGALALRDRIVKNYRDMRGVHERITQRQWQSSKDDARDVEIDFRFRKPNRLYLAIDYPYVDKPGRWQLVYVCDGKTLTVYNGARNEFQSVKSPAHLDRLVLPQVLTGPEFILLLRDLSPFEAFEKSAFVRYTESYDTVAEGSWHTLHIDLRQEGSKRLISYQTGAKDGLIHGAILATTPDTDTVNPFVDPEVKSNAQATYTLVESNPRFTDADFKFALPAGAKEQKPKTADEGPHRPKGARASGDDRP